MIIDHGPISGKKTKFATMIIAMMSRLLREEKRSVFFERLMAA